MKHINRIRALVVIEPRQGQGGSVEGADVLREDIVLLLLYFIFNNNMTVVRITFIIATVLSLPHLYFLFRYKWSWSFANFLDFGVIAIYVYLSALIIPVLIDDAKKKQAEAEKTSPKTQEDAAMKKVLDIYEAQKNIDFSKHYNDIVRYRIDLPSGKYAKVEKLGNHKRIVRTYGFHLEGVEEISEEEQRKIDELDKLFKDDGRGDKVRRSK